MNKSQTVNMEHDRADFFGAKLRNINNNSEVLKVQAQSRRMMREKHMRDEMEAMKCKVRFH